MSGESKLSENIWVALEKVHVVFWILSLLGVGTLILAAIEEIRQHWSLMVIIFVDSIALLLIIAAIVFQDVRQRRKSIKKINDIIPMISQSIRPKLIDNTANRVPKYLVVGNNYFHIPNVKTFNRLGEIFGFDWSDCVAMTSDEIKQIFTGGEGKQLPDISEFEKIIETKQKSKQLLEISGPFFVPKSLREGDGDWRITVHNKTDVTVKNVQVKLTDIKPPPRDHSFRWDYPHIVSPSQDIHPKDNDLFQIFSCWPMDGYFNVRGIDKRENGNWPIRLELNERWELTYQITAEDMEQPIVYLVEVFTEGNTVLATHKKVDFYKLST